MPCQTKSNLVYKTQIFTQPSHARRALPRAHQPKRNTLYIHPGAPRGQPRYLLINCRSRPRRGPREDRQDEIGVRRASSAQITCAGLGSRIRGQARSVPVGYRRRLSGPERPEEARRAEHPPRAHYAEPTGEPLMHVRGSRGQPTAQSMWTRTQPFPCGPAGLTAVTTFTCRWSKAMSHRLLRP